MLVEFAIVFLSIVLLTIGIMNFAELLWILSTVSRATTIAARCAAVSKDLIDPSFPTQCPDYQQFAAASAFPLSSIPFKVEWVEDCGTQVSAPGVTSCAAKVTATITYKFAIFPYQLGPYNETACVARQQPCS
jgi:hypothetical protein